MLHSRIRCNSLLFVVFVYLFICVVVYIFWKWTADTPCHRWFPLWNRKTPSGCCLIYRLAIQNVFLFQPPCLWVCRCSLNNWSSNILTLHCHGSLLWWMAWLLSDFEGRLRNAWGFQAIVVVMFHMLNFHSCWGCSSINGFQKGKKWHNYYNTAFFIFLFNLEKETGGYECLKQLPKVLYWLCWMVS